MVSKFYDDLCHTVDTNPLHHMLIIGCDFNAKTNNRFSTDGNGVFLQDFANQFNLFIGNTSFQKPTVKLWTCRSPTGSLSQIDYIYRCIEKDGGTLSLIVKHSHLLTLLAVITELYQKNKT